MKHARRDYDRFQDPAGLIPADEPVLILRGQDVAAPAALLAYAEALIDFGAEKELVDAVFQHRALMQEWQAKVKAKTPDVEKAQLR